MSTSGQPLPSPKFTRKSETESICMFCFSTVRGDQYKTLEDAEDIHVNICLLRPDSALRYVLL